MCLVRNCKTHQDELGHASQRHDIEESAADETTNHKSSVGSIMISQSNNVSQTAKFGYKDYFGLAIHGRIRRAPSS
jgi:hypothetical protein